MHFSFTRMLQSLLLVMVICSTGFSQAGGGGGGGGTGGGGGGTGGGGTGGGGTGPGGSGAAGVEIDAAGVLRVMQANPQVTAMQLQAAKQSLPSDLSRPSKMRKVSLNRLEKAAAKKLAAGKELSPEMIAMAGLTRVEYVFFYPESGDIVLAGPAEGFGRDSLGRIVGVDSQRPCILLDDTIVALRAFGPNAKKNNLIKVSIDPTQEGLQRYKQALARIGGTFTPGDVPFIVNTLQQALGLNEVTIGGIPAGTHFAHILTEADYRMKLIGIGLEPVPVPMKNYISRLSGVPSDALVRWFFVPDYDALVVSEDGSAMHLVGNGVKLIGEDEKVDANGNRSSSGKPANAASRGYTTEFSKKFNNIAASHPVYAQLRNLVDLSIAAAYIQDQDMYGKSNWNLGVFADEDKLAVEVLPPPRQVETAINAVMKGSRLITPIGGGVQIQARNELKSDSVKQDKDGNVAKVKSATSLQGLAEGQWWWD